jgi:GNAT superfamily N-acetyltransferase
MLQIACPSDRPDLEPLLDALPYSVPAYAILAGTSGGRVWIDTRERPRIALAWDGRHNLYLARRPEDTRLSLGVALYEAIEQVLKRQIFAFGLTTGSWGYVVQYGPIHLCEPIVRSLLRGREAIPDLRRLYKLPEDQQVEERSPGNRMGSPAEGAILPVDEAFLRRADLEHHRHVTEWVAENWADEATYCEQGFGFVWTQGARVLSWCMAEYVAEGPGGVHRAGVGIETLPEARNQGYATRLARAFVAECGARETVPHWDCWNDNLASVSVAEKAGFRLHRTYPVRFGWFNMLDTAVVHLRLALERQDVVACRGWLRRVLARADTPAVQTARLWPNRELVLRLQDEPELAAMLSDARVSCAQA